MLSFLCTPSPPLFPTRTHLGSNAETLTLYYGVSDSKCFPLGGTRIFSRIQPLSIRAPMDSSFLDVRFCKKTPSFFIMRFMWRQRTGLIKPRRNSLVYQHGWKFSFCETTIYIWTLVSLVFYPNYVEYEMYMRYGIWKWNVLLAVCCCFIFVLMIFSYLRLFFWVCCVILRFSVARAPSPSDMELTVFSILRNSLFGCLSHTRLSSPAFPPASAI